MIKKTIALLVCLFLLPQFLPAKTIAFDLSKKTTKNGVVRSVIFPGWGQFFLKRTTKGYVIMAGALVSAAAAYYYNTEAAKAYDNYKTVGVSSDGSYSDYQNKFNNCQYALLSMAIFWVYGVADILLASDEEQQHAKNDLNRSLRKKDGLKLACDKRDLKLMFNKSF